MQRSDRSRPAGSSADFGGGRCVSSKKSDDDVSMKCVSTLTWTMSLRVEGIEWFAKLIHKAPVSHQKYEC